MLLEGPGIGALVEEWLESYREQRDRLKELLGVRIPWPDRMVRRGGRVRGPYVKIDAREVATLLAVENPSPVWGLSQLPVIVSRHTISLDSRDVHRLSKSLPPYHYSYRPGPESWPDRAQGCVRVAETVLSVGVSGKLTEDTLDLVLVVAREGLDLADYTILPWDKVRGGLRKLGLLACRLAGVQEAERYLEEVPEGSDMELARMAVVVTRLSERV